MNGAWTDGSDQGLRLGYLFSIDKINFAVFMVAQRSRWRYRKWSDCRKPKRGIPALYIVDQECHNESKSGRKEDDG